jgi:hypothetical protein
VAKPNVDPRLTQDRGTHRPVPDRHTADRSTAAKGTQPASRGPPTVDVITGAGPHTQESTATPITIREAFERLEGLIREVAGTTEFNLGEIGNRSKMLTREIAYERAVISWIRKTLDDGRRHARAAAAEQPGAFEAASARHEAAMIAAQVAYLDVSFLTVADAAESAGAPWPTIDHAVRTHWAEMAPIRDSVVGFDRQKMKNAAAIGYDKVRQARAYLDRWIEALKLGTYWSQRAIAAADAFMVVHSLYKIGQAVSGAGRGGPPLSLAVPRLGGSSGGAATAVMVRIPAGVIEGIRKLIEIGALALPVLAMGTGTSLAVPMSSPGPAQSPENAAGFTNAQIAAAKRFFGRQFDKVVGVDLARIWNAVANPNHVQIVARNTNMSKAARDEIRSYFGLHRNRFWTAVKNDPAASKMLNDAGFYFDKSGQPPKFTLASGKTLSLDVDHFVEIQQQPNLALTATNLRLVSPRENRVMLRLLNLLDPFQKQ